MNDNIPTPSRRWSLSGKRALVTGGTKGIGAAIADELLTLGATVTVLARTEGPLGERLEAWAGRGLPAYGLAADVTAAAGRDAAIAFAYARMSGIDILVNNVGTNIRKASTEYVVAEYATVLETNLAAAWEMCRAAQPALAAQGGSIVNIGSVAGSVFVGSGAPYAMSKAAMDELTRYLAVEWADANIRVNSVNPWYTRTPLAAPVLDDPERLARVLSRTPLGRIASAEDVAAVTAFLCMPAAAYLTGQCIAVDGGFLAYGFNAAHSGTAR
jgi:Tropinone reductase 1